MSDILKLLRPELLAIKPFDAKRPGFEMGVLLDANETPWVLNQFEDVALNRYIDEMFEPQLMETLAAFYQTLPSQILLTRGSCEGIDLLVRAFCRPQIDSIIVCPPTFSIFAQSAMMQGAKVLTAPLQRDQDFAFDRELVLERVVDNTKLVFICTPNNPTGNLIPIDDIIFIAQTLQGKAMVVVDEAYMEFANGESAASLVATYSNIVVLRTFSKAFGLAGLRCGSIIAQAPIINVLTAMMLPFPMSLLTTRALKQALLPEKMQKMKEIVAKIHELKAVFKQRLQSLSMVKKVWDSEGNFLFVQLKHAQAVLKACQENTILVRHFMGVKDYDDCLRITVGLASENEAFLEMLSNLETVAEVC